MDNMITHIPTGKQFNNRLECKLFFGHADYNRRLRRSEFTFHDGRIMKCNNNDGSFNYERKTTHTK